MSVTDLITVLIAIENSDEIENRDDCVLNWGYIEERHRLIQDAVALADQLLVFSDGTRNYDNEREISLDGFYVTSLETDSFGWLTGAINTTKGLIAYG
jgi:hypothetical protein